MSLQTIINISNSLNIDRRKLVGIQYARNELARVSETPTYNPWKLTVATPNSLKYNEARGILETLDTLDRRTPETITFSNNGLLNWMFAYQGGLAPSQLSNIVITSFTGNQMILNVSAVSASPSTLVLKKGDFIQILGYPYPFTSTTDVARGSGTTVTVTTHRPNIITDNVAGLGLNWGNNVQFRMFCPNMPTYTLLPGGQTMSNGVMINNAYIEFSDQFRLYEWLGNV